MKVRESNKAINSTSFNRFNKNKISNVCKSLLAPESSDIELEIDNIQSALLSYSMGHNRFVPEKMYQKMVKDTAFNSLELEALQILYYSAMPGAVDLTQAKLNAYATIIASQLASPEKWAKYPVLDKLHITVDITRDELKTLLKKAQSIATKARFKLIKNPPKRQNGQFHETVLTFCSKEHDDAKIYLFLGDNAKSRENPINLLRIELNPARHSHTELKCFFSALKQSKCIKNYASKMKMAKVTHRDLAIDLLFCPMPVLIADKSNVKDKYSNHSFHKQKGCDQVQTINIGDKERSHTCMYAKSEKIMEARTKGKNLALPLLVNSDTNPITVSRIEQCQKKQQDGGTLRLIDLDKKANLNLFKSFRVYRPELLRTVTEDMITQVIRDGYMVAMKKKSAAAFSVRNRFLQQFQMYINEDAFKKLQKQILKKAKRYIIYPDK